MGEFLADLRGFAASGFGLVASAQAQGVGRASPEVQAEIRAIMEANPTVAYVLNHSMSHDTRRRLIDLNSANIHVVETPNGRVYGISTTGRDGATNNLAVIFRPQGAAEGVYHVAH